MLVGRVAVDVSADDNNNIKLSGSISDGGDDDCGDLVMIMMVMMVVVLMVAVMMVMMMLVMIVIMMITYGTLPTTPIFVDRL